MRIEKFRFLNSSTYYEYEEKKISKGLVQQYTRYILIKSKTVLSVVC